MTRTASELAQYLHAQIEGDPRTTISSLASPENAGSDSLIYVEGEKHRARAQASRAGCILAPPGIPLSGKTVIRVGSPKLAFAKSSVWLFPRKTVQANVHPTAIVSPKARISAEVSIGPNAVIEDDVSIGSGTEIGAFCFIGRGLIDRGELPPLSSRFALRWGPARPRRRHSLWNSYRRGWLRLRLRRRPLLEIPSNWTSRNRR